MVSSFMIYDLTFLVVFTLFVIIFLYKRRSRLKREGLLYLYKTKIGIKFIDSFSKKYEKILRPLQYLVLLMGYILMVSMTYFIIKFSWIYLKSPVIAKELKIPVLIPLIPYLPELFKIDFLPSFNFTYWIIVIAIIAIPHEFAHGIFARINKIKIHSTGFGFLGPFLAAFVEPDEKKMSKSSKFAQLSVLASGTFANILSFILFGVVLLLFFASSFSPSGVYFNAYASNVIPTSSITEVNGIPISSLNEIPSMLNGSLIELVSYNKTYLVPSETLNLSILTGKNLTSVYEDAPAIRNRMIGAISEIDGEKITSYAMLNKSISSYKPGDIITVKTLYQESLRDGIIEEKTYTIKLAEKNGKAFLGIGIIPVQKRGLMGYFSSFVSNFKDPMIFYESSLGSFGWFIYYLIWWTVLISLSVALVNMLPVGIFDGGRFFYLTVWGITRSEKFAKKAFTFSTYLFIALILALMFKWILIFF